MLNTRDLPEWFVDYLQLLIDRHRVGAKEYGISTYKMEMAPLLEEIMTEIADIAGWGAFAYRRAQKLRNKILATGNKEAEV